MSGPLQWLTGEVAKLKRQYADVARRSEQTVRHGTVQAVDPKKALVRLVIGVGSDGTDKLSPWVPYSQVAGALKIHSPPSVGQPMSILSPGGDIRQAVAIPTTWSDANPAPSDKGDEHKITLGSLTIVAKGDSMVMSIGGVSITVNGDGVKFAGGTITHDDHDIGKTHKHTDVQSGGDLTGPPQ